MSSGQTSALRWVALIVLLAGGFLPPVDFFIVNVGLSSIQENLNARPAELQLVISGYAAAYAVFLITGGRLGDLYGRRRCFLWGLTAFSLASLGAGIAMSPGQLVAARLIQGSAAAILQPQVLGSIRALFPDERELARAMSCYGIMMGMAAVVGQFGGGALIQWNPAGLGWRAIFLLTLPVCAAVLAAGATVIPKTGGQATLGRKTGGSRIPGSRTPGSSTLGSRIRGSRICGSRTGGEPSVRLDLTGAALVSVTLAAIVVPLSEGREQGWPAWLFIVLACVPLLTGIFLWHEHRLARAGGMPLVDLTLLRIPSFRRGVLVAMLFFFTTSFYLLFGLYQQEGRGAAPLRTGLAIVPYGVGLFLGPLLTAPLARLRPRLLSIGMAIQVTFYIMIGLLVAYDITGLPLTIAVLLAGFGQGIAFPRLYATVLGDVPAPQAGVAAGITNTALQIGAAISVAAIGSLFFTMLGYAEQGHMSTERAYAHAFAIAQWTLSAGLFLAMLIALPPRRYSAAAGQRLS